MAHISQVTNIPRHILNILSNIRLYQAQPLSSISFQSSCEFLGNTSILTLEKSHARNFCQYQLKIFSLKFPQAKVHKACKLPDYRNEIECKHCKEIPKLPTKTFLKIKHPSPVAPGDIQKSEDKKVAFFTCLHIFPCLSCLTLAFQAANVLGLEKQK